MPDHLTNTLKAAYDHQGFSFVHVYQRCPHFDPNNFDHKSTTWFSFLESDKGIPPDKRIADKTEVVKHDPSSLEEAFKYANSDRTYFGLFYHNPEKPRYDKILHSQVEGTEQQSRETLLDAYKI